MYAFRHVLPVLRYFRHPLVIAVGVNVVRPDLDALHGQHALENIEHIIRGIGQVLLLDAGGAGPFVVAVLTGESQDVSLFVGFAIDGVLAGDVGVADEFAGCAEDGLHVVRMDQKVAVPFDDFVTGVLGAQVEAGAGLRLKVQVVEHEDGVGAVFEDFLDDVVGLETDDNPEVLHILELLQLPGNQRPAVDLEKCFGKSESQAGADAGGTYDN